MSQRRAVRPPIEIRSDHAAVPLTRGQVAIIDIEDVPVVGQHLWTARPGVGTWYAYTKVFRQFGYFSLGMHRLVMGLEAGRSPQVDHRDSDGLNNRRGNLRLATAQQNIVNRPPFHNGFKGVSAHRRKWMAKITVNGDQRYLGLFDSPEDAARAYDSAAFDAWGEFAHLNLPAA